MGEDTRATEGQIEETREHMGDTVSALAYKADVPTRMRDSAAEKKDRGERCDLEVAMAKVFASETAVEASLEAMKILGGNGYSKDFPIERYYRDAPLTLIGGGTGEIVRLLIARRLLAKYAGPA